jgi:alpha-tubulin suppressor-like RCC1 family protein
MTSHLMRHLALAITSLILASCSDEVDSPTGPSAGSTPSPSLRTASAPVPSFTQVSGGSLHTCGVTPDHRLLCWGIGMFGDGKAYQYDPRPPVRAGGAHRYRQVSSAYWHTCGITTDNRLFCWGWNFYGQIGDGTLNTVRQTPVRIGGSRLFRQVDAAEQHTCAIDAADGKAYCWGDNSQGELGDGTTTGRFSPVPVAGNHRFRQIAAGGSYSCGLTTASRVLCWGSDQHGSVGNGPGVTDRTRPTLTAGNLFFRQVDAQWDHVCAVTTANRAYCWGFNGWGQLGDGATTNRFAPTPVSGGIAFERLGVGSIHTCGETTLNRAYCWGGNDFGQLGNGTTTDRRTPSPVKGDIFFRQLGPGGPHTCGVASNSVAYCWGNNEHGQLGDGTIKNRSTPTPVRQTERVTRSSSTLIESDDPDPSARGQTVTVRYAVGSDPTVIDGRAPTGTVTVRGGGASCTGGLAVSSVGETTISRGSCSLTLTSSGTVTLVGTYSGDDTFARSQDAEAHQVE